MMATESPVRMVESGGGRKWPTFKDSAVFESPIKSMAEEEFELLLKGCTIHGDQMDMIPSRSGSAPPSMEGSFAAISNILAQQSFTTSSSLESLREVIENFESEEQLRSDPAYFTYYCSNVNLNPRLPPPLMSRENRRLVRHMGGFGNTWRPSLNDDGNKSFQLSKGSLPTHKEEPEDDGSPKETVKISSSLTSGRNTSLAGRHKSLVDLIQEDFPRTPSPVYSQSRSSSFVAEEAITRDVQAISTNISSLKISKVAELDPVFSDVSIETHAPEAQAGGRPSPQRDGSNNDDVNLEGSTSLGGSLHSDVVRMESQHHLSAQQSIPHQAPGVQVQSISQGMKQTHNVVDNRSHTYAKPSPIDLQPSSHPPALNPHLCASTAAYMNSGSPLYPNFQPSGLYSPQYSVGGYPFGSGFIPPFVAGYPSHSSINAPFGASSSSSGENIVNSGGFQHLGKIYGQQGLMLPPSFADRHHMQYFQHPFVDAFGATAPHNLFALNAATSGMIDPFVATKSPSANANYQKALLTTNGNIGIPGTGGVGFAGNSYYISSTGMGVMPQFPASPLASPVLPSSPVGGINLLGRQNSMVFSQGSSRNAVPFSGGQGQRGLGSFDDPKRHNFLEELKSSSGRKVELSDIAGHIVEFSVDQHGSRFIQQKLEHCSVEEKESVFNEILPHSSKLMTDVFGNYVIQKFFEHGGPEQRKELADKLAGQMLHLSLQMYGCRVIQKALEVIEPEQKAQLVQELDGHVIRCVHDQNGNHVIQKCIECVPADNGYFIISAFHGQVATLSTHPYGCRVIQRVLEHCLNEEQSQFIVDEILESADILALDQYGNYVTQHVLERGKPQERSRIISKLKGKFVQMSQHKYASNVVEKCLKYGDMVDREHLIQEIIGQSEGNDNLLTMMKDQFANYVVQKILDTSNDDQKKILLNIIRSHLQALKKYTYGKHIVARFEQLCAEETQTS